MDTAWLEGLTSLIAVPGAIWGFYAACVHTNRKNEFERKANKIRLARMEAEAKLDLKLREWQQVKSLEDLERHRRRLEDQLDEMHEGMDNSRTSGGVMVGPPITVVGVEPMPKVVELAPPTRRGTGARLGDPVRAVSADDPARQRPDTEE